MKSYLLTHLACPECGSDLECAVIESEGDEIMDGTLSCHTCYTVYPIECGVPRLNRSMEGLERVARTFTYEWKAHHRGELEKDTLFGLTPDQDWKYFLEATGAEEQWLAGRLVLDAGCGSGRLTRQIGDRDAVAIGMDINEAVDEAFELCRDHPNVHIVQGNIFAPPFKKQAFDLVWSNGVIHHTPDARGAHESLSRLIKPGGILYVWVYAKRFNPFRFVKDVLDFVRVTRLPERLILGLSKVFARVSLLLLGIYRAARAVPGLRPSTVWGKRTVRPRSVKELELTWFDALSPEHDSRHTEAEVIDWFERFGFEHIAAIDEPKVGVRGRAPT